MRHTLLPVHIAAGSLAIIAGFIALYVVKGATVHRKSGTVFVYAMVVMAVTGAMIAAWSGGPGVALGAVLTWGLQTLVSTTGRREGLPAFPFLLMGIVGTLAAAGDVRMIRAGVTRGAPRLARHLWRMCWALWIASSSFFLGQMKVMPKAIRIMPMLAIPPLTVLVAMVYWLWRVRARRTLRGIVVVPVQEAA